MEECRLSDFRAIQHDALQIAFGNLQPGFTAIDEIERLSAVAEIDGLVEDTFDETARPLPKGGPKR